MMYVYPIERSEQVSMIVVAIVFMILPTIAIILRLIARRKARGIFDITDWFMVSAWVLAVSFQIMCIIAVRYYGMGFHMEEIAKMYGFEATTGFWILLIVIQGLWLLSLSFAKFSVILLYRKLFSVRSIHIGVWITGALIIMFILMGVAGVALVCQPFAYIWDSSIPGGHCGDIGTLLKITGAGNIVTDFAALTIALPTLYKLQLPTHNKIVLMGTFGLGFIAVIVSIARVASLATVDWHDITYTSVEAMIFTAVEPSLAIVIACVPLLRPLLGPSKFQSGGSAGMNASDRVRLADM